MKSLLPGCVLLLLADSAFAQNVDRVRPVRHDSTGRAAGKKPTPKGAAANADSTKAPVKPAAPEPPAAMALNIGAVVFSGNIQAWYKAGSSDVVNTFLLRRAELKFVGTLSPTAKW